MWYEVLPSLALVTIMVGMPPICARLGNYFFNNGKPAARYWEAHPEDFQIYLRDRRITGSEYVPRGLEGIPSENN